MVGISWCLSARSLRSQILVSKTQSPVGRRRMPTLTCSQKEKNYGLLSCVLDNGGNCALRDYYWSLSAKDIAGLDFQHSLEGLTRIWYCGGFSSRLRSAPDV